MRTAQTKSVTLRLDVGVNNKLDRYCKAGDYSKSLLVNCALAHFLDADEKTRLQAVRNYVIRAKVKR